MSHGKKTGPELPLSPPLDFDPPSNGEFIPLPPTRAGRQRWELWRGIVEEKSRRLGITRREFAESACGTAAWLFAINQIACDDGKGSASTGGSGGSAAGTGGAGMGSGGSGTGGSGTGGSSGGGGSPDASVLPSDASGYDVKPSMMEDMAQAREALAGNEFVFDVQTHVVQPEAPWMGAPPDRILNYMKLMFVDSDTTVACLSGIPSTRDEGLASPQGRAQLQELVERFGGSRLLFHCNTDPQLAGEPEFMAKAASMYKTIAAWKSYPQTNPEGLAADNVVNTFVKGARETGIKIIASHRGLSGGGYISSNSPRDVVQAALKAPDLKFLIYHSGWQSGVSENHPYDPAAAAASLQGVDRFVRAMEEAKLPPNSNVYAELGSTWRGVLGNPNDAAHLLGKLLKYVGPDNVLYGTDCVMSGNPQPQINALRMFSISPALQQQFGYPELTAELKRKILGLNGAKAYGIDPARTRYVIKNDELTGLRSAFHHDRRSVPMPDRRQYAGPRTRKELFAFLRREKQSAGNPFG
jgi:predicted TIM-barrel fold metal-dependent hydrolase